MDTIEGYLLVPPERSQILSRTTWKVRYVVVGRRHVSSKEQANSQSYTQWITNGRGSGRVASKQSPKPMVEDYSIAIYKSMDELEPLQVWPINLVTDCQVQYVAPRKQDYVLPTLIVTLSDKERKRRSSRAVNMLPGNKESPLQLFFRTSQEHLRPNVQEWAQFIQSRRNHNQEPSVSPASPVFTNPFASRARDGADFSPCSKSTDTSCGSPEKRQLQHKSSANTYSTTATREKSTPRSETPSLRSRRSDISSPSSAHTSSYVLSSQQYTAIVSGDLASPVQLGRDNKYDYSDGWSKGHENESTVSSPVHTRSSVSSQAAIHSVTEPAPVPPSRETILDRAFQMKYIPGSEKNFGDDCGLSSLARFDALMRAADEKRKKGDVSETDEQWVFRSTFEIDDSDDDLEESADPASDSDSGLEEEDEVYDRDCYIYPPGAKPEVQRTLKYVRERKDISSDDSSSPAASSCLVSAFNSSRTKRASMILPSSSRPPISSPPKTRPGAGKRTQSMSQIPKNRRGNNLPADTSNHLDAFDHVYIDEQLSSDHGHRRLDLTDITERLSNRGGLLSNVDEAANEGLMVPGSRMSLGNYTLAPSRKQWEESRIWRTSLEAQGGFL